MHNAIQITLSGDTLVYNFIHAKQCYTYKKAINDLPLWYINAD